MINLLDLSVRKAIIDDLMSEENKRRKADSFRRLDIYKKNQRKYILERIQKDLSPETLANMRTFTSINFTQKIIDGKASVYKHGVKRVFSGATDREQQQIDALYKHGSITKLLKKANRYFKLEDQCSVQILPKRGKVIARVLAPHHFDVIPSEVPEYGDVYILSGFNKQLAYQDTKSAEAISNRGSTTLAGYYDNTNQKIADREDYFEKLNYFVFWSKDLHFATNRNGEFLNKAGEVYSPQDLVELSNPIGEMPFVDLAVERDFEYWAQTGSNVTDLQLDLGAQISDTCDVNFRQGYSQAVLSATEAPRSMQIGPHTVLFLKKDPRAEATAQPEFAFATPSPDLASSIRLTEMLLSMGLTSEGVESNMISTGPNSSSAKTYSSGYERLIAQIDEFSASQSDFELFEEVEQSVFNLLRLWSNLLQDVKGENELIQELRGGKVSESIRMDAIFSTPQMVQSQGEKEDSAIKKIEAGLMSRKMAIKEIYGVDDEMADQVISEIDGAETMDV